MFPASKKLRQFISYDSFQQQATSLDRCMRAAVQYAGQLQVLEWSRSNYSFWNSSNLQFTWIISRFPRNIEYDLELM